MPFRIQSISEFDRFLVVDIGTSRVKALVCSIESGEVKILSHASIRQSKRNFIAWEIADLRGVADAVRRAIMKAGAGLDSIPDDMVVGFDSNSLLYDAIGMNYVRKNPEEPITMEEIDDIVKEIEGKSIERVRAKMSTRLGLIDSEMKLITTSVTSIHLDGKKVSNPLGFAGKNIKFHILNLFVPISDFTRMKSIVRDTGRNLLSFVPIAVTMPKLLEESDMHFDYNLYLDIGYSRVTVTVENDSEILWSNVIPFGTNMLEEILLNHFPEKSHLDIDYILENQDKEHKKYSAIFDTFHQYLLDAVSVAVYDITRQVFIKNVLISGGGSSQAFEERLFEYLESKRLWLGANIAKLPLVADDVELLDPSYASALSLARAGKELFHTKKDPIARILRYVIYRYE